MPQLRHCVRLSPARGARLDMEYLDKLLVFGLAAGLVQPLVDCGIRLERDARRRLKPLKITVVHVQG